MKLQTAHFVFCALSFLSITILHFHFEFSVAVYGALLLGWVAIQFLVLVFIMAIKGE